MAAAALLLAAALAAPAPDAALLLQQRARQDELVSLYVRTRACMRGAGLAAVHEGVLDRQAVQYFMVRQCGEPLRLFLQADSMPEASARDFMVRLSRTSYYEDVLRIPEPKEN